MPDIFAAPDDDGSALRASDLRASLGEQMGAEFMNALDPKNSLSGAFFVRRGREAIAGGFAPGAFQEGIPAEQAVELEQQSEAAVPDTDMGQARARVKQAGLEGHLKLPDQPSIKAPVLDLMIQEAQERRDREAAIARGPQGFYPDALGMVTSIGAGMIDPVNIAAFSIPVVGEARWGKIIESAGESIAARAALNAGRGAAQGALGTAVLQPADWWLHTRDGQDYTFADVLKQIALGAGMGGAAHAGFGAAGDVLARRRGEPLPGSRTDVLARRALGGVPEAPEEMTAQEPEAMEFVHPAELYGDLPPAAQQDALRVTMADMIDGQMPQPMEMLRVAADHDARIAESVDTYSGPEHNRASALRPAPTAPDPLDLAMSGELNAERARQIADGLAQQQTAVENQIFGDRADEWRKLNKRSDRAWDNARDEEARQLDAKIAEIEREVGLTNEDENWLNGQGWSDFSVAENWRDLARNLQDIENGRDDAVGASAAAVRDIPKTNDWSGMTSREREAVITLLSAMNEEKRAGRDPKEFLRDVFKERIARYGGGHDAREIVGYQMEELAELLSRPIERGSPAPPPPPLAQSALAAPATGATSLARNRAFQELGNRPAAYDAPEEVANSRWADSLPEPASVDPRKSAAALQQAVAEAEQVWRDLEPYLSEEERRVFNDALEAVDRDAAANAQVLKDGAACLAAAVG
jgi:hypothetical protein